MYVYIYYKPTLRGQIRIGKSLQKVGTENIIAT
jgi:hypothetical protein